MGNAKKWAGFVVTIGVAAAAAVLIVAFLPTSTPTDDSPADNSSDSGFDRWCEKRFFGESPESFVCVCNASYCDTIPELPDLVLGEAVSYTSRRDGLRFSLENLQFGEGGSGMDLDFDGIVVDTTTRYQQIKGFGGAFTDAASLNIASLSAPVQDQLLRAYFSPQGIEYNMARIPMASCDFSTRLYTYDDTPDDFELKDFALAMEDVEYKIPMIKRAMSMSEREMSFFGSPWSAPAWMKTNNNLTGKGKLKSENEYRQSWADYFVRFIEEYEKRGVAMWGLTAQNEPNIANTSPDFPFQNMAFTAEEQRNFVRDHLGPTLVEMGRSGVKLMIGDDQRTILPDWAETVLADGDADKYVSGIGVHWYTDMIASTDKLQQTHEKFPDKFVIGTEACSGAVLFVEPKVDLGSWTRGQYYSTDILDNLNNWSVGWVDWNLVLDMQGGPNWVGNYVDAPVIVNAEADEFYKQPMFYHMGHFSKFIPEGSWRVDARRSGADDTRSLRYGAFVRPDDATVTLVVLNKSSLPVRTSVRDPAVGDLDIYVPAHSIQTYLWPGGNF